MIRRRGARILLAAAGALFASATLAGPYVTEASGIRWNDVGGIRWNDVGGIRWNDVGGIRWNDVGGIRWNDVGGLLFTDASGIRWNDVGGIRWNDVGGVTFDVAGTSIDLELLEVLDALPNTSWVNVIVTYHTAPSPADLFRLTQLGVSGGTVFRQLPMVALSATKDQIRDIAALPEVRSVWSDRTLSLFDRESADLVGLPEATSDPDLRSVSGAPLTGAGVTIAILDTGADGTHPDLPYGSKLVGNVRLLPTPPASIGFHEPQVVEGVVNTDLVLGHGTFVSSVAAGTGAASQGRYAGVAPGASLLALSAGDYFIMHMLEGFDYILDNRERYGIRVVNCSWGTEGWFDPDDPVNVATRALHDAGVTVVFAAGNHGPAPDSLNPYAVAPWVVGVGSTRKDGSLSKFSSRGIHEELLYHPTLVAPGESIVAAKSGLLERVNGIVGIADPSGASSVPSGDAPMYAIASGTSFAAPHVAGTIALMIEADPTLTPAAIKRILQQTSTPMPARDRSEIGAGRLDAWAAIAATVDPARPFGGHFPFWLDARPYRIEHRPQAEMCLALPAAGRIQIPFDTLEGALSWQIGVAWGTAVAEDDLDVRLLGADGNEIVRSDAFNGLGLFGRADGLRLVGSLPSEVTAEVYRKHDAPGTTHDVHLRIESAVPIVTAYDDLTNLSPADASAVAGAISRGLILGRGDHFEPLAGLTRGELATSLALVSGSPQRIPGSPTFSDTTAAEGSFAYVETVAGRRSRRVLMDGIEPGLFDPGAPVRRIDVAVALVRAAGLVDVAVRRAGVDLPLVDDASIPAALKGYVSVAFERGLMSPLADPGGVRFAPDGSFNRIEASRALVRLLSEPAQVRSSPPQGRAFKLTRPTTPRTRRSPTGIAPSGGPD